MFSARFENALEHATDEELFSFFFEVPSVFRRRLIAVLSELEFHEAQHNINTPWSVGGRLEPRLNLGSPQIVVIVGFGTWVPGLVEPGFQNLGS